MRASWLALLFAAGCQPSVASGTYLCGDEELCPQGQACDGPTNTCVVASTAQAFSCMDQHEPDDTAQEAFALPAFGCVSTLYSEDDCLVAGDLADWRSFAAPTGCTAVAAQIEITNPIAFEPLAVQLWDLTSNAMVAAGTPCGSSETVPGSDASCITQTLVGGHSYGIVVQPAGGGDCGGKCNFNRYSLQVQTVTP